uniref:Uncharacterized protein n=1 Tax=viral metagenome TaxID=1070528 RepID=A0A6C0IJK0_9ZZZZ
MKLYKFIKKNKLILGIIIIIFGVFLFYSPIIEGLTANIGEYEFLAPPTDNISDDMLHKLFEKIIKNNNPTAEIPELTEKDKKIWKDNITNKEINYYLENNKFPISPYVINKFKEVNKEITNTITDAELETALKQTAQAMPNRLLYGSVILMFIQNKEKTNPSDGYLIYMGTKPAPSYSSPTYSVNNSSTSLTDLISSGNELGNNKNYNDFVSLCKRVK